MSAAEKLPDDQSAQIRAVIEYMRANPSPPGPFIYDEKLAEMVRGIAVCKEEG